MIRVWHAFAAGRWRRLLPLVPLGILLLAVLVTWALDPRDPALLEPTRAWQAPSREHWLGCGEAGSDLLRVTAHALGRGIMLATMVACAGFSVGVPLGAWMGFRGSGSARALGRICDLFQAFPSFLLAMAMLAAVRAPTRMHLFLVFATTAWAPFARLALVEAEVLRSIGYVEASRALGQSTWGTLRKHIVPNLLPTTLVQLGASASAVVVSEAALAFVGLGPRDGVSLGALLEQGVVSMLRAPHVLTVGALAVFAASQALIVATRVFTPQARSPRD
jgi:peptide/nickel transport system permease protein